MVALDAQTAELILAAGGHGTTHLAIVRLTAGPRASTDANRLPEGRLLSGGSRGLLIHATTISWRS